MTPPTEHYERPDDLAARLAALCRRRCIIALGRSFDVIIVGGRIAGLYLGGVLARAGLTVVVLEKEPRFRDRVRGEGT